jgi:hypothetical protein
MEKIGRQARRVDKRTDGEDRETHAESGQTDRWRKCRKKECLKKRCEIAERRAGGGRTYICTERNGEVNQDRQKVKC